MNKRKIGSFYEDVVCEYLLNQGIEIIEKNFRCHFGEIDIIGREKNTLLFIEVKYRKNDQYGMPQEAVTEEKKRVICKCATYYCMKHSYAVSIRYDVVAILDTQITWIKNAFEHKGYRFC